MTPTDQTPVQPQSTRPAGLNSFALVSFITALCGISILGLVFGFIALSQIKETGQEGHGFAIAGITISFVSLGIVVFALTMMLAFFGLFARAVRIY